MKTGTIELGNASIRVGYPQIVAANQRGHARELTEFFVPEEHRGKGEGSELLKEVCEQADQDRLMLIITADSDRLAEFYSRHGFIALQKNPIVMARMPSSFKMSNHKMQSEARYA